MVVPADFHRARKFAVNIPDEEEGWELKKKEKNHRYDDAARECQKGGVGWFVRVASEVLGKGMTRWYAGKKVLCCGHAAKRPRYNRARRAERSCSLSFSLRVPTFGFRLLAAGLLTVSVRGFRMSSLGALYQPGSRDEGARGL